MEVALIVPTLFYAALAMPKNEKHFLIETEDEVNLFCTGYMRLELRSIFQNYNSETTFSPEATTHYGMLSIYLVLT